MLGKHPIQPLEIDGAGVLRFKENMIVRFILDHGSVDMNDIARKGFTREDREQFAQLIGYSHSGASDLEYMSDEVLDASEKMFNRSCTEQEARLSHFSDTVSRLRDGLRAPMAELFHVHPDDLT